MKPGLSRLYRRIRFGEPVVVVSGLPRSGTSMTMQMLEAGGLAIATDGLRPPNEDNPRGYYELERVTTLHREEDKRWIAGLRGKAVKVVAFFLKDLPPENNYRVLFMERSLEEILASQARMLARRGEADASGDDRMREIYEDHVLRVKDLLRRSSHFDMLEVSYRRAIDHPLEEARRIQRFLGVPLDPEAMARAVDAELYRNRS